MNNEYKQIELNLGDITKEIEKKSVKKECKDIGKLEVISEKLFNKYFPKSKYLIGKKFNKLMVIDFSHNSKGDNYWRCLCECGNETIVKSAKLNNSHKKSCGCLSGKIIGNSNSLEGKRFGRWVVIKFSHKYKMCGDFYWECKCDCGKIGLVSGTVLRKGKSKSCGCRTREVNKECQTIHGKSKTPEYSCWRSMIARCYNEVADSYPDYGGRGITVCDRWLGDSGFINFLQDMGERPKGKTLDRINSNKNYEPSNCRWSDKFIQANNRSNNINITYNGKTQSLKQWSRELNLPYKTIYNKFINCGRVFKESIFKK